jgi:hypothetical protein
MNEVTTTKLLAITAVIFVTAALITLSYQNQVANAQPTKRYQAVVTLTDVPANAEDLEMNATLNRDGALLQEKIVSSPSEGDKVRFVFRVPSETNIRDFIVCANLQSDPDIFNCDQHFFSSEVRGPIRVDFAYPT